MQRSKKYTALIFGNRVGIKIFLLLFPILAVITFFHEFFLIERSIITFMAYQMLMCILLVLHMLYSWIFGGQFDFENLAEFDFSTNQLFIIRVFS